MLMMAKPRRPHKDEAPGLYWFYDEARLQRLYEYCKQDIQVERELYLQLQPLIPQELKLWQLDFVINARGFHFNRTLAEAARKIAQALGPELNAELKQLNRRCRDQHFSGCPAETMVSVARFRGRPSG
jgi:DNA polymerase